MERIRFAIEKAREAATQRRLGQAPTTMDGAPVSAPWATAMKPQTSTGPEPLAPEGSGKRRRWPAVLFLGVAALIVGWAMWSAQQNTADPSTPQASAASPTEVTAPSPVAQAVPTAPAVTNASAQTPTDSPAQAAVIAPKPLLAPVVPLEEQVKNAVEAWREDWAARNMMAYLDHYSEAFTPADGASRREWIASRYRNVGGRSAIEVQIKSLQVMPLDDNRVRVGFLQDYASGSYRETAQPKTLELVRESDDRWRIVGEWQGEPPALAAAGKS